MPYLIDTCVVSEFRKPTGNAGVLAWMSGLQPEEAYLSAITLGEIRRGIELRKSKDAKAAGTLERWLLGLETHYTERILPVTAAVADRWGRLCPDQPLPFANGLIAATAIEHKLTVVTRNVTDFRRSGVNTVNPFS